MSGRLATRPIRWLAPLTALGVALGGLGWGAAQEATPAAGTASPAAMPAVVLAGLYQGTCDDIDAGTAVTAFALQPASDAGTTPAERRAHLAGGATLASSPADLLAQPHAIAVYQAGGTRLACGDVAGPAAADGLLVPLRPAEESRLEGTAWLGAGSDGMTPLAVVLLGDQGCSFEPHASPVTDLVAADVAASDLDLGVDLGVDSLDVDLRADPLDLNLDLLLEGFDVQVDTVADTLCLDLDVGADLPLFAPATPQVTPIAATPAA